MAHFHLPDILSGVFAREKDKFVLHNNIHYSLGRHIVLILAAASMAACGSQSSAAPNKAQTKKAASSPASAQANPAPRTTPATTTLPIAQGIYISGYRASGGNYFSAAEATDLTTACGGATEVFFYDGTNIGDVRTNEEYQGNDGPSSDAERITRIGPPRTRPDAEYAAASKGFTLAWTTGEGDFPRLAVKAAGARRFVRLSLGGNRIISYDESTYQQCAFSQLSPRMQAAIRSKRPQLAVGAATGDAVAATRPAAAAAPAPVAPFNIRPGHYVPVAAPCNSTSEMIYYYDGRRRGWIDVSPFNPNHMDPVAGVRRRGADWLTDPDMGETLRVQAPDRIEIGDPNTGTEVMRWCPANAVRASARAR